MSLTGYYLYPRVNCSHFSVMPVMAVDVVPCVHDNIGHDLLISEYGFFILSTYSVQRVIARWRHIQPLYLLLAVSIREIIVVFKTKFKWNFTLLKTDEFVGR